MTDPLVLIGGADHRAASITLDKSSLVRKEFRVDIHAERFVTNFRQHPPEVE